MYKRIFFIGIVACQLFCQTVFGQKSVDSLFDKLKHEENATCIHLGKLSMTIASFFTETMGVKGVEIVTVDGIDNARMPEYAQAASLLDKSEYDMHVGEPNSQVLVKTDGQNISEIVVFDMDSDNISLVRINGNIKPSDMDNLISKYSNER